MDPPTTIAKRSGTIIDPLQHTVNMLEIKARASVRVTQGAVKERGGHKESAPFTFSTTRMVA